MMTSHSAETHDAWSFQVVVDTQRLSESYRNCPQQNTENARVCVCVRERGTERERQRTPVHVCSSTHPAIFVCACNQPSCHATKLAVTHHVKLPSSLIHALMIHHRWSRKLTYSLPMQVYFSFSSVTFQKRFKVCQTFHEEVGEKPRHIINE